MSLMNLVCCAALALPVAVLATPDPETLPAVPRLDEDQQLRTGLDNCRLRFQRAGCSMRPGPRCPSAPPTAPVLPRSMFNPKKLDR